MAIDTSETYCTQENMECLGFETREVNTHYYHPVLNYAVYFLDSVDTMSILDLIEAYQNHNNKIFPNDILENFEECIGGTCPTITLQDSDDPLQYSNGYPDVLGGTLVVGEFTLPIFLEVVSGTVHDDWTLEYASSKGTTFWFFTGQEGNWSIGTYTFTLGGEDANGCPITPKEFTITIYG